MAFNFWHAAIGGAIMCAATPVAAQQGEIKDGEADYGKVLSALFIFDNGPNFNGGSDVNPILFLETLNAPSVELPHVDYMLLANRYSTYLANPAAYPANGSVTRNATRYELDYFASDSSINGAVVHAD